MVTSVNACLRQLGCVGPPMGVVRTVQYKDLPRRGLQIESTTQKRLTGNLRHRHPAKKSRYLPAGLWGLPDRGFP
jgi:hypothetical protein